MTNQPSKNLGKTVFKKSALCIALSSTFAFPTLAFEEAEIKTKGIERIEVTASRRASTVQEAPLNITALDADVMKEQNLGDLADVARFVPGLSIPEQGRAGNSIIVRGLNTNSSGPQSDGGTVATYFGEQPLAADIRLIDVERVEVLIGPQGTLYGAGSLGGAIRYIPNKAELDTTSFEFNLDGFKGAESDSLGSESSFIFNTPLIEDTLAIRASFNAYDDPGFIDYDYVINEPGVSVPDNKADTHSVKDANGQKTLTSRIALRWTPTDDIDATLSYLYQNNKFAGRSTTNYQSLGLTNPLRDEIGKYSNASRYLEPDENTDQLISLEISADLGFAELVSATGFSKSENVFGQRDQSDLLLANPWSYETMPAFSAFTRETGESDSFTQEIRLVSQSDSDLSWIVGGYYNKQTNDALSEEYAPNYQWSNRDDDLEYLQFSDGDQVESALFGEISYQATEQLGITIGARFYEYEINAGSAFVAPFVDGSSTLVGDTLVFTDKKANGESTITRTTAEGDGNLFKFNVNYKFTDDILAFVTVSEGFRLGGTNGIGACPDGSSATTPITPQKLCALPDELAFGPDSTTNYELGFKSTWFNNQLYFNAAIYSVDWEDAQVGGASTINGNLPYSTNAGTANSKGVEISTRAMITDSLTAFATYSYAKAELTSDVFGLFAKLPETDPAYNEYSGQDGDRLPGAPEQQFSMGLNYTQDLFDDKVLDVVYGMTYQSDVYTNLGLKAESEVLAGFALSNLSATISAEEWSVTLYVDNMFDKYAFTSARSTGKASGFAEFPAQIKNPNTTGMIRSYGHYVTAPRTIGLKFNYLFDM